MGRPERLFQEIAREQDLSREKSFSPDKLKAALLAEPLPKEGPAVGLSRTTGMVALGLSAAAGLFLWLRFSGQTLDATISGQSAAVGAMIVAPQGEDLPLRFSDGTEIELRASTQAQILGIDEHGAQVRLDEGELRVHVQKRPRASWKISVGPYQVAVTGTRFSVRYEPKSDDFRLALEEGSVELSGCVFGDQHQVTPGQVVHASCRRSLLKVKGYELDLDAVDEETPLEKDVPSIESPDGALEEEDLDSAERVDDVPSPPRSSRPNAGASSVEKTASWQTLAAQRKYREAFAEAQAAGFENQCLKAGSDDLLNLANAARYSGRGKEAAQAYRILRRRFPGSSASAYAAFSLGVLAFDARGSYSEAATWFRTYIAEQPSGSLTREARGRLMEAVYRSGNRSEAETLARQYLGSYPKGPHAKLARQLTE